MHHTDRKAAVAAYKEKKTAAGVFAVRCAPSGQVWVGDSTHLETQQNGLWFTLRTGSCMNRGLQAAWIQHGEAAFSYEPLEALPEGISPYLKRSTLLERAAAWRTELGALPVV